MDNKCVSKFKKEIGITIKVRKQVASCLAKKLLSVHSTGSIGYYLCLCMQTQFQLGSYVYPCTNKMHPLVNLQDIFPTLAIVCVAYNLVDFTVDIINLSTPSLQAYQQQFPSFHLSVSDMKTKTS